MKKNTMTWMTALACAGLFSAPAFADHHEKGGKKECACAGEKGEKCTCGKKKGCKCEHKASEEKAAAPSGT